MRIVSAVQAFLSRMELVFLCSEDGSHVVVPLPDGDQGAFVHVDIFPDEEAEEVALRAVVAVRVPPARRPAVALVLAQLNTERKAVTWSMTEDGFVLVDAHVELACGADAELAVALGYARLTSALFGERGRVHAAMARPRRHSRVEQEVEQILERAAD